MLVSALQAGMTHDQFWDATPHEVMLSLRAHARNFRNTRMLFAQLQSGIMGALIGKKAPSVNRLMGGTSLMGMSNEEIATHYAEKKAARVS